MTNDITEKDYRNDVDSYAIEVRDRVRDEGVDECDAIHDAVDGSQWVIYTYRARHVLMFSTNEDAIFDEGIGLQGLNNSGDLFSAMAYWAMRADVAEALAELPTEEEEQADDEPVIEQPTVND